jgi:tRNA uridine 5-carboxymethylaminomethyl modification enzyme
MRLTEIGYNVGLISKEKYEKFLSKKKNIEKEIERLRKTVIKPTIEVNEFLRENNSSEINNGVKLIELLKRTEISYKALNKIDEERPELTTAEQEEVEIEVKYEGYIKLQLAQVEKFKKLENKFLSEEIDYLNMQGISLEARQKLDKFKPNSIGQASRISGISPADITVLLIYLEQNKNK